MFWFSLHTQPRDQCLGGKGGWLGSWWRFVASRAVIGRNIRQWRVSSMTVTQGCMTPLQTAVKWENSARRLQKKNIKTNTQNNEHDCETKQKRMIWNLQGRRVPWWGGHVTFQFGTFLNRGWASIVCQWFAPSSFDLPQEPFRRPRLQVRRNPRLPPLNLHLQCNQSIHSILSLISTPVWHHSSSPPIKSSESLTDPNRSTDRISWLLTNAIKSSLGGFTWRSVCQQTVAIFTFVNRRFSQQWNSYLVSELKSNSRKWRHVTCRVTKIACFE